MSHGRPIGIMLVDDHVLVREGLEAVIRSEADLAIVASVGTGSEALSRYGETSPDVVLLDVRMPGMDGLATLAALRAADPRARVVMLSSSEGDRTVSRALAAGAVGYVLKSIPSTALVSALRRAVSGKVPMSAELAVRLAEHAGSSNLTEREVDILRCVAQGESNKEIAAHLSISLNTVKNHVVSIMQKLSAADRTQAVTIALQRGIIDLDG